MFLQREHTNSQKVYESVFNISNHWGNANQNHNEESPHTISTVIIQTSKDKGQ